MVSVYVCAFGMDLLLRCRRLTRLRRRSFIDRHKIRRVASCPLSRRAATTSR
jgi:hypothetical protein